ncbi:DUF3857 and transglutaminase domain-containing protein [Mucilaginibacter sp. ZT4R22]|uniref:DUF3857 and transglutaminase domain-containing protein n=1 Tax=Mucilaginibacter pankratovii TaxID=2772110 RepID=A0ABR7WQS2_9SPHI|nr:DUF3857 domain-containing protein [Mucilaginibacter pankratovii]MBD1364678.1 DUF3857 and transglutaminase domain-containing protein [Mucilaginibacter pankratovii]
MKIFKHLLALLVLGFGFNGFAIAQDKKIPAELYVASTIPDSLKEDANSVVRYYMEEMIVKGPGKATMQVHSIITILNEKANNEAEEVLSYNKKFSSVGSFEMKVYNAAGVMIKKYKKSEMYDHSAVSGETIVSDDRLLVMSHTVASYPTTVEFIYDEDYKSLMDLGQWTIQHDEQSVQNSYYRVSIANNAGFRYLTKNTTIKPVKTSAGVTDSYLWQASNLKAIKLEDGAESWQVLPAISFATSDFEYYGMPGNISTWQNFGKWIQALYADVSTLSPARVAEIQKMTEGLKTDKEKAKFLYEYMQRNMRYVSIQLGIGGLKPFPAAFVDEKKYGDCKALSNYMYTLLKAVNIQSYHAIIKGGENEQPADVSFPVNQFNHEILCIPFKGDTTWLECTSSTAPFGKLGPFTENRNALLVTEEGGKLVNTPKSTGADHQFKSEVHIVLNADGGAKAKLKLFNTGEYRSQYIGIAAMKLDDQKEYLIRLLNMKQPSALELVPADDKDGVKEVDIELVYEKFCDIAAGNKNFYRPRVFDLWRLTVPVLEKRKTDFYFDHPLQKSCVTTIDLPAGFEVETLPTNQSLKFSYGNYEVNYVYDAAKNQVVSTAKFNLTSQVVPAAKYNEMQVYMDAVAKAQNKKLVIRKKA